MNWISWTIGAYKAATRLKRANRGRDAGRAMQSGKIIDVDPSEVAVSLRHKHEACQLIPGRPGRVKPHAKAGHRQRFKHTPMEEESFS